MASNSIPHSASNNNVDGGDFAGLSLTGFPGAAADSFSSATWTISGGCLDMYYVWPDRFVYKPITPIESSSGFYSGGDPCDRALTADQFAAIDKALHVFLDPRRPLVASERRMGVSILTHQSASGERQSQLLESSAKVASVLDQLRRA